MDNHIDLGRFGEKTAKEYLVKNRYEILMQNYREKFGEIDLIAKSFNGTLVFIEVKTLLMKGFEGLIPEDNFTTQKSKKVNQICKYFAANHQELINDDRGWRIDLIAVEVSKDRKFLIRHYENV